jgi:hypothetical protein
MSSGAPPNSLWRLATPADHTMNAAADGGKAPNTTMAQSDVYVEDLAFDVRNLLDATKRSNHDAQFSYCMADIDAITGPLGIIWGKGKTLSFALANLYLRSVWDVQRRTVAVPLEKCSRYLATIRARRARHTHMLCEAQELHGRLQHLCFVLPLGRAYLAWIQIFLGLFNAEDERCMERTPLKHQPDDLGWWEHQLPVHSLERELCAAAHVHDVHAYSDASSETGVGVVIGDKWRAGRLLPGWQDKHRRIQWAQAVRFELVSCYLFADTPRKTKLRVWGDNNSVVKGWWRGTSANIPTNEIFKCLALFLAERGCAAHTRYVESARNPADDPSRGVYGDGTPYTRSGFLPPLTLPPDIAKHIVDLNAAPYNCK